MNPFFDSGPVVNTPLAFDYDMWNIQGDVGLEKGNVSGGATSGKVALDSISQGGRVTHVGNYQDHTGIYAVFQDGSGAFTEVRISDHGGDGGWEPEWDSGNSSDGNYLYFGGAATLGLGLGFDFVIDLSDGSLVDAQMGFFAGLGVEGEIGYASNVDAAVTNSDVTDEGGHFAPAGNGVDFGRDHVEINHRFGAYAGDNAAGDRDPVPAQPR